MRTLKLVTVFTLIILSFYNCSDDDSITSNPIESELVTNLFAPTERDFSNNPPTISGEFVKFDFSSGSITTSETDWDIAFRGTTILVNGGATTGLAQEPQRNGNAAAYLVNTTFENVTEVDESLFVQDSGEGLAIPTGSDNGWYNYNPPTNTVSPLGNTIVFRTADGRYAKVQILSFYKDAPAEITPIIAANDLDHYTFNFVYQPNEGQVSFD
jgi:hypothetical protein